MIKSIQAIEQIQSGDLRILSNEKWLMFLSLTPELNINYERLNSMDELKSNYVLSYVEKTLRRLTECNLYEFQTTLVEETLKWSEVAKAGLPHQRKIWLKKGYNLSVHNIGSAQIYNELSREKDPVNKHIIHTLIATHGLIGQYIRGEVSLSDSKPLHRMIEEKILTAEELKVILTALNDCIISAVDENLWDAISGQINEAIELILTGNFENQFSIYDRIKRLRTVSIQNGENIDTEYHKHFSDKRVFERITELFTQAELWYVEAALFDFSFEEFTKIFLLISNEIKSNKISHISFGRFMNTLYYQHNSKKRVNIYKKRIIEKYLSELSIEDILLGKTKENLHVAHEISVDINTEDTVFFNFIFSPASSKLIDFCVEAEKSDVLYESAVILLFDLFGLRKDLYDRFYEEESYLQTMNQSVDFKSVLLDDIIGNCVIDIGPGGGALMDLIEDRYPKKTVIGVDFSQNVIDSLKKKKQLLNKHWDVIYGDALNLGQYIKEGSVDTIIFCSIFHELYSYIEFKGKKFNYETLAAALTSAYSLLPHGGRILIRDGIMTEPESQNRIIRFLSKDGMDFLKRYAVDFKGREIIYKLIGQNEVRMSVNDAMEFLYTYTWGEKSYVHEVNEQFGYFTPSQYQNFITLVLGNKAKILKLRHFLQDGYPIALSQKIEFFDENRNPVRLPDSTCIIVIEKP